MLELNIAFPEKYPNPLGHTCRCPPPTPSPLQLHNCHSTLQPYYIAFVLLKQQITLISKFATKRIK